MKAIGIQLLAVVLAFLVSTQIELLHHLERTALLMATLVISLLMISVDYYLLGRRRGMMGRIACLLAIFVAIWFLNVVSTITTCNRATHRCHKVFTGAIGSAQAEPAAAIETILPAKPHLYLVKRRFAAIDRSLR